MNKDKRTLHLSLAALGVVYGDIGTSAIYALRECFYGPHKIDVSPENVFGVLSLVLWSLLIVVSGKYLLYVMRAENKGEGGIAALVALLNPWRAKRGTKRWWLMLFGLFGAALLYGDGALTPAVSVLSAIEGLEVATPAFKPYVVPITALLLIGLFAIQRFGTGGIGAIFGPVMLLWFASIGALGVYGIVQHPQVLAALSPHYAVENFLRERLHGFIVLGSVFLVLTGAEALYADMGHFGRNPIRIGWFTVVLPGLVLNYFGQGAVILLDPEGVKDPFYQLAPGWALYPLVGLATLATVIASQALISGAFSLTRQLVQLGQLPRMAIVQTSRDERGQIYIPSLNWLLMIATIALVVGFKSSSALAAAYGIAVSTTMVITTVLAYYVARRYGWSRWTSMSLTAFLMVIDLAFFGSNLLKLADGGWIPVVMALAVFTLMTTWGRGRVLMADAVTDRDASYKEFIQKLLADPPYRIRGTGVFLTGGDRVPAYLLRHVARNKVLHEHVILLTVKTLDEPRVPTASRMHVLGLAPGIMRVTLRYGFMQIPNVPVAMRLCEKLGLQVDADHLTYYLGRETPIPSAEVPGMALWRDRLFAFLARNSMRATDYYQLPPEDVVEVGVHIEI
jgi:KUP system potassium uptake protein